MEHYRQLDTLNHGWADTLARVNRLAGLGCNMSQSSETALSSSRPSGKGRVLSDVLDRARSISLHSRARAAGSVSSQAVIHLLYHLYKIKSTR